MFQTLIFNDACCAYVLMFFPENFHLFPSLCWNLGLSFSNNAKLSFAAERAEGVQGEQPSLSGSWTSPQLPSRVQSVRSPTPYKKQLNEELQRRSSTVLGKTVLFIPLSLLDLSSHCFPRCLLTYWLNFSAIWNSQVFFKMNETIT